MKRGRNSFCCVCHTPPTKHILTHHTRTPADGINVYSFALRPEEHQQILEELRGAEGPILARLQASVGAVVDLAVL